MAWESGYQLRVREKSGERIFPLLSKTVNVGRAGAGKVPSFELLLLDDPTVSRHHATLKWQFLKRVFMLHHKSETNSTLVNGEPSKRILLAPEDLIQIGDVVMRLEKAGADTPRKAAAKPVAERAKPVSGTARIQVPENTADSAPVPVHVPETDPPPPKPEPQPERTKEKFIWKPPEDR